jgi:hypothetical protein
MALAKEFESKASLSPFSAEAIRKGFWTDCEQQRLFLSQERG